MRTELHCHSTCSDGSLAPVEVAERAAKLGVELFCLTDHDTLDGCDATVDALVDATVLRGLELSCVESGKSVHLLVYLPASRVRGEGVDELQRELVGLREERVVRLRKIVDRLRELGVSLDADEILSRGAPGKTAGRPDVARALVEAGAVTSIREAFTRYLRDGGPADVAASKLSLARGLELGEAAGARMSLAHPHTHGREERVAELCATYRDRGLTGLEVHYGRYSAPQKKAWSRVARRFDLVETGGSDFHGEVLPEVGRPVVDLPDEVGVRLLAWLGLGHG